MAKADANKTFNPSGQLRCNALVPLARQGHATRDPRRGAVVRHVPEMAASLNCRLGRPPLAIGGGVPTSLDQNQIDNGSAPLQAVM